jgi:hypothetical protein
MSQVPNCLGNAKRTICHRNHTVDGTKIKDVMQPIFWYGRLLAKKPTRITKEKLHIRELVYYLYYLNE